MHVAFMGERLLAIFGQIFGREKLEGWDLDGKISLKTSSTSSVGGCVLD
jgi:hypothetical protein